MQAQTKGKPKHGTEQMMTSDETPRYIVRQLVHHELGGIKWLAALSSLTPLIFFRIPDGTLISRFVSVLFVCEGYDEGDCCECTCNDKALGSDRCAREFPSEECLDPDAPDAPCPTGKKNGLNRYF